jgi:hypothetical protein
MPTEKEIIEAADAAVASLTDETFRPSMDALARLCKSGMAKPDAVEALPQLFDFVARGMAAQQAVDAVLARLDASKQKS